MDPRGRLPAGCRATAHPRERRAQNFRLGSLFRTDEDLGLLPLFIVLLLAQFAGFAFSVNGVADLIASPFLGKRSDTIGYRRVLIICCSVAR
jgi:MFS family permease